MERRRHRRLNPTFANQSTGLKIPTVSGKSDYNSDASGSDRELQTDPKPSASVSQISAANADFFATKSHLGVATGRVCLRSEVSSMRTDARVTNSDPGPGGPSQAGPSVAQLLELLQTAYPVNWEQLLRKRLAALGVTSPFDLTPARFAEFRDQVFWAVKQAGIKDPAGWISQQEQLNANKAAPKLEGVADVGHTVAQPKSADREPVTLENCPAIDPVVSALPPAPRTTLYGNTKAEVLGRIGAAVEAGAPARYINEMLACAHEGFHASQREIGRAIGLSASTINRLLKWRQTGYKQRSPFGPTTRAGRAAHRNRKNDDVDGGADRPEHDGTVSLVEDSAPPSPPTSLPAPNEDIPSASAPTEVLPGGEAAESAANGIRRGQSHRERRSSIGEAKSFGRKREYPSKTFT